jgi:hypothetical protein
MTQERGELQQIADVVEGTAMRGLLAAITAGQRHDEVIEPQLDVLAAEREGAYEPSRCTGGSHGHHHLGRLKMVSNGVASMSRTPAQCICRISRG